MNYRGHKDSDPNHLQKRLKIETHSPPTTSYYSMCNTTSSSTTPNIPLPPPLTFNSTNKPKQGVSPVNGTPAVIPFPTIASIVQSCSAPIKQRPKEATPCKCQNDVLSKLNTISCELTVLTELVQNLHNHQATLALQISETKERVQLNTDLLTANNEQLNNKITLVVESQLEQTNYIKSHNSSCEQQTEVCREYLDQCKTVCIDIQKHHQSCVGTLQALQTTVRNSAQQNTTVTSSIGSVSSTCNMVPHLTHDPIPSSIHQQLASPQLATSQHQLQVQAHPQSIQVQLPANYQTSTLQHIATSKTGTPTTPTALQIQPIQVGDSNKYYLHPGSNGVQTPIQMIAIPSNMIQGIQAIQSMQNNGNIVQFVSPSNVQALKQVSKPNRPTEIRPKQTSTPKKNNELSFQYPSTSVGVNLSPKHTNILEEASKIFSNPTLDSDSFLYNTTDPEKDALSAAIMNIPTTYAQHDSISQSFTDSMREAVENAKNCDDSTINTSEMLSQAINVVGGDMNLCFDKVMVGPNGEQLKDLQIPCYLSEEVINCVFRKSKEPSIYALNICREILTKEEFINFDFKSFVSKNPLKYKFVEHLLSTKFCLYSDHLQSILKDVRIKFNNYHRHVKRSARLKENQKQEQLQIELERIDREQRSSDKHLLELLKQEPASDDVNCSNTY